MIKYKVIHSTISFLQNIEMEHDFSGLLVGDKLNMFGHDLAVTQIGGGIVGVANDKNIMVFQEQLIEI